MCENAMLYVQQSGDGRVGVFQTVEKRHRVLFTRYMVPEHRKDEAQTHVRDVSCATDIIPSHWKLRIIGRETLGVARSN